MIRLPVLSLAAAVMAAASPAARAAKVYYVNQPEGTPGIGAPGMIHAVNPDGTDHTTIFTAGTVTDMRGIAVDPVNSRLFFAYCELSGGTTPVQVSLRTLPANAPPGTPPVTILNLPDGTPGSASNPVADVEYDPAAQRVYFSQPGLLQLRRCNADGSGLATVLTHPGAGTLLRDRGPYFFGLDLVRQEAYWAVVTTADDTATAYTRGTLAGLVDGSFSLVTPTRTRDIEIDPAAPGGPRLYWNDRNTGAVYSRTVEGGGISTVRSGLNAPHGLVIDPLAGKGYVADTGKRGQGNQASSHRVVRFNLDGSGSLEFLGPPLPLTAPLAEPWDLAVDFTSVSFNDWRRRFFEIGAAFTGMGDDPDGDGLTNIGEYVFFTNPRRSDAWAAAQVIDTSTGAIRIAVRKQSDVSVRVEISTDLSNWDWNRIGAGVEYVRLSAPVTRDSESDWVTVTPVAGALPTSFSLRLRALAP